MTCKLKKWSYRNAFSECKKKGYYTSTLFLGVGVGDIGIFILFNTTSTHFFYIGNFERKIPFKKETK